MDRAKLVAVGVHAVLIGAFILLGILGFRYLSSYTGEQRGIYSWDWLYRTFHWTGGRWACLVFYWGFAGFLVYRLVTILRR